MYCRCATAGSLGSRRNASFWLLAPRKMAYLATLRVRVRARARVRARVRVRDRIMAGVGVGP